MNVSIRESLKKSRQCLNLIGEKKFFLFSLIHTHTHTNNPFTFSLTLFHGQTFFFFSHWLNWTTTTTAENRVCVCMMSIQVWFYPKKNHHLKSRLIINRLIDLLMNVFFLLLRTTTLDIDKLLIVVDFFSSSSSYPNVQQVQQLTRYWEICDDEAINKS